MGVNVQQLPDFIGISRRTLFVGRASDFDVTAKTWLKLEAAEKMAEIGTKSSLNPDLLATNETYLNDSDPSRDWKSDQFSERLEMISQKFDILSEQVQKTIADFPMSELKSRMSSAGAWPPAGDDLQLTPSSLLLKYQPPTNPHP